MSKEKQMKNSQLFRTQMIGGYQKKDVDRYVKKLQEELEKQEKQEKTGGAAPENKNRKLIEEAIREINKLREENKRLRNALERQQE